MSLNNPDFQNALSTGLGQAETFLKDYPDLEKVELMIPDINGVIMGKWAPAKTLKKLFEDGVQMPLSIFASDIWGREVSETGIHIEQGDQDGVCFGVPGSIHPCAWTDYSSAQVFMTMYKPDGTPWELDPRHILSNCVSKLSSLGLKPVAAFEMEFYLLPKDVNLSRPEPVFWNDRAPEFHKMYSLDHLSDLSPFISEVRKAARIQNIPLDTIISEAALGQYEINLNHVDDVVLAADQALMLKKIIRQVAKKHGFIASFMPKPFEDVAGNGMHVHCSLIDENGDNVFADSEGDKRLKSAIAGLLKTIEEVQILFTNSFNGFRRLNPGTYAPTKIGWGYDNRTVALRIPTAKDHATRIEHRLAGPDASPYLVLAALLAGMLHGIEEELDPPQPVEGNAYVQDGKTLTNDMKVAIDRFKSSSFLKDALGEEFCRVYGIVKEKEWFEFQRKITLLEHQTYL